MLSIQSYDIMKNITTASSHTWLIRDLSSGRQSRMWCIKTVLKFLVRKGTPVRDAICRYAGCVWKNFPSFRRLSVMETPVSMSCYIRLGSRDNEKYISY